MFSIIFLKMVQKAKLLVSKTDHIYPKKHITAKSCFFFFMTEFSSNNKYCLLLGAFPVKILSFKIHYYYIFAQ